MDQELLNLPVVIHDADAKCYVSLLKSYAGMEVDTPGERKREEERREEKRTRGGVRSVALWHTVQSYQ